MDGLERALAILIGTTAALAAAWVLICHGLARLGGWRALARAYPAPGTPGAAGETLAMRSVLLRAGVGYRGIVRFTAGPAGVRLRMQRTLAEELERASGGRLRVPPDRAG